MDITFTLTAYDKDNKVANCGSNPCLTIIGLLPGTTTAYAKPPLATTIVDATASAASSITSALPVGGTELTAATSGAKVTFDSLFPPKTTAIQYAYIDNESDALEFG